MSEGLKINVMLSVVVGSEVIGRQVLALTKYIRIVPEQLVLPLPVLVVTVSGSIDSENIMTKFASTETLTSPSYGAKGLLSATVGGTVSVTVLFDLLSLIIVTFIIVELSIVALSIIELSIVELSIVESLIVE